jgi:hypothetical protein
MELGLKALESLAEEFMIQSVISRGLDDPKLTNSC